MSINKSYEQKSTKNIVVVAFQHFHISFYEDCIYYIKPVFNVAQNPSRLSLQAQFPYLLKFTVQRRYYGVLTPYLSFASWGPVIKVGSGESLMTSAFVPNVSSSKCVGQ